MVQELPKELGPMFDRNEAVETSIGKISVKEDMLNMLFKNALIKPQRI